MMILKYNGALLGNSERFELLEFHRLNLPNGLINRENTIRNAIKQLFIPVISTIDLYTLATNTSFIPTFILQGALKKTHGFPGNI